MAKPTKIYTHLAKSIPKRDSTKFKLSSPTRPQFKPPTQSTKYAAICNIFIFPSPPSSPSKALATEGLLYIQHTHKMQLKSSGILKNMNFSKLLQKLKALNLPNDQYVIIGSGPLAVRNLREAQDLDILTSDSLWNELSQKYPVIPQKPPDIEKIQIGNIEFVGQGSTYKDSSIATLEEILNTADFINGFPYLNLNLLKKFKLKMAREKDLKDIKLIDQFHLDKA